MPTLQVLHPAILRHLRFEASLDPPEALDLRGSGPDSLRDARQVCGAERGRLYVGGPYDAFTQNVGLELHEEIVDGRAAVDPQFTDRFVGIGLHRIDEIFTLQGY